MREAAACPGACGMLDAEHTEGREKPFTLDSREQTTRKGKASLAANTTPAMTKAEDHGGLFKVKKNKNN